MKRVLIYKGADDFVIWDASTDELLKRAHLSLFNYLDKEMEFYSDLNAGELFLEEEELKKKEELKAMPADHPLYFEAQAKVRHLESDRRELEERKIHLILLEKARKGDAVAAKRIIGDRREYEYEGWDVYSVWED